MIALICSHTVIPYINTQIIIKGIVILPEKQKHFRLELILMELILVMNLSQNPSYAPQYRRDK